MRIRPDLGLSDMRAQGIPRVDELEFDHVQPETSQDSLAIYRLTHQKEAEHFQIEGFRNALSCGNANNFLRHFSRKKDGNSEASASTITLNDMLTYSPDLIPMALLKQNGKHNKRAINMFADILKYMGEPSGHVTYTASIKIAQKLLNQAIQSPDLKDELYIHLIKQTRHNPNPKTELKAWELFYLVASNIPPSKLYIDLVTNHMNNSMSLANAVWEQPEIREKVAATWHLLNRSAEVGARHKGTLLRMLPSFGQIAESLKGQTRQTTVFFLDGKSVDMTYDSYTTILEAVEKLASIIKLQHYKTFTLFECKPMDRPAADRVRQEHITLDDNKYIADVLHKIQPNASHHRGVQEPRSSGLLFKKHIFLQTDELVTEPLFVNLSYVQAQFAFLQENYPLIHDDAAKMCALQVRADCPLTIIDQETVIMWGIEKYITKSVLITQPRDKWLLEVTGHYRALEQLSNEEARLQFLRIFSSLPYGNSIFFSVTRIKDPIGLLPAKLILGINKQGIHFFQSEQRRCIYRAELEDISQYVSAPQAVSFKVRVGENLELYKFKTHQGDDICKVLQTHIDDRREWISETEQINNGDRTLAQTNLERRQERWQGALCSRWLREAQQQTGQQLAFEKDEKAAAMHQVRAHLSCQHRRLQQICGLV
jgi:hypothetical protein